jgi:hypothetical protein
MSEQNILNPSPTSSLNPDYTTPVKVTDPQVISRWQARSGKPFARRLSARGAVWDLTWANRMFADYAALRQWFSQYENDFFTYADWDFGRYYTGMFADQPTVERAGNNKVNITAQFVVVPTLPLYQYPSNWTQDSIFMEERGKWPVPSGVSPSINDLVKLTGSWDHRDLNYLLWSQDYENAAWSKQNGCTVTADQVAAPDGTVTADLVTSGNSANSAIQQSVTGFPEIFTYSLSVRAGSASQANLGLWDVTAAAWVTVTAAILSGPGSLAGTGQITITGLTSSWTRVSLTTNSALIAGRSYLCIFYPNTTTANTLTNYCWGQQLEVGSSATTYTPTVGSTATLSAPVSNANYHGGFAYFESWSERE